jgi:hemerythrin superfamily protein
MATDAIVLLKDDHKRMRALFRQFEQAGDAAYKTKGRLATKILEELTVHTYLENECVYPETRRLMPELEDDIFESYEEHHVADVLCMELSTMSPQDDHFTAKMTVLIESVEHHMQEEEQDWFPKVRKGLGRKTLQDMGDRLEQMRPDAPHKPFEPKALQKAIDALRA